MIEKTEDKIVIVTRTILAKDIEILKLFGVKEVIRTVISI
jgi:hypothetical protein